MGCWTVNTSIEIKKAVCGNIIVPTPMYAREIWTWNDPQRSWIQAVKRSYLRGGCSLIRGDGEKVIKVCMENLTCRVVEVVKCSNLTLVTWRNLADN